MKRQIVQQRMTKAGASETNFVKKKKKTSHLTSPDVIIKEKSSVDQETAR
jgi:hypothetical protein